MVSCLNANTRLSSGCLNLRVFLAREPCDMRKSFDGLQLETTGSDRECQTRLIQQNSLLGRMLSSKE